MLKDQHIQDELQNRESRSTICFPNISMAIMNQPQHAQVIHALAADLCKWAPLVEHLVYYLILTMLT